MLNRFPLFSTLTSPLFNARGQRRPRLPFLAEPNRAGLTTPAPSGGYAMRPGTVAQVMTDAARGVDPLTTSSQGEVVASIAKGAAPQTADATKAQAAIDAKKKRQLAARVGLLRNAASVKPPVLSAPGTSSAPPAAVPAATRAGQAANKLI